MKTLAEKIKQKSDTPYQIIAKKFKTTEIYVGLIARNGRKAVRGKALLIKQELEKMAN